MMRLPVMVSFLPVVRKLELRNTGVLQQLNRVKGVLVTPPQHTVTPGGDPPLC